MQAHKRGHETVHPIPQLHQPVTFSLGPRACMARTSRHFCSCSTEHFRTVGLSSQGLKRWIQYDDYLIEAMPDRRIHDCPRTDGTSNSFPSSAQLSTEYQHEHSLSIQSVLTNFRQEKLSPALSSSPYGQHRLSTAIYARKLIRTELHCLPCFCHSASEIALAPARIAINLASTHQCSNPEPSKNPWSR